MIRSSRNVDVTVREDTSFHSTWLGLGLGLGAGLGLGLGLGLGF